MNARRVRAAVSALGPTAKMTGSHRNPRAGFQDPALGLVPEQVLDPCRDEARFVDDRSGARQRRLCLLGRLNKRPR